MPKEIGGFPIVLTYKFGTFHLHLEIPLWRVPLRSLRDVEGALGRLRKALRPYQLHGVVSDIVAWKKDGRSYDQIAQELNELVADHLKQCRVYEFQIRCDKDKTQEEIRDLKLRMEEDMHYVRHVFYWMGFSAEAAKIVADAFKVISVEMRKRPPSLPALAVDKVEEPIDEDDLEELPPGWDEYLSISFKKGWDETNEFVRMTQPTRRKHRKGPPYRYPITAERVRARLRSLGLA